ncbi:MAG: HAD family phosphatase [Thermomicrobiales bacterium]
MTEVAPVFEAVIFDMDGVLVESEHLWEENWVRYSGLHAYEWLPSDTAMVQGMSVPEWARYLAGRIGGGDPEHIMDDIVANMIASLHGGRVELLPGSFEMVMTAAARVPIAVASSASFRFIEAVLEATGLRPSFSAVVSSEQVPNGKPAPDVYLEAARRIGVEPTRAIAIEDSSNGLRAAAAAGMHVIALPNPTYPPKPDALERCAKIATSTEDVRAYLIEHLPAPI